MTSDDDNDLTIDELARKIGMTVRNVRAHQSRGLLPPPTLRGRTGYYGKEHVARLEARVFRGRAGGDAGDFRPVAGW